METEKRSSEQPPAADVADTCGVCRRIARLERLVFQTGDCVHCPPRPRTLPDAVVVPTRSLAAAVVTKGDQR